jgi:hypothetical protein
LGKAETAKKFDLLTRWIGSDYAIRTTDGQVIQFWKDMESMRKHVEPLSNYKISYSVSKAAFNGKEQIVCEVLVGTTFTSADVTMRGASRRTDTWRHEEQWKLVRSEIIEPLVIKQQ